MSTRTAAVRVRRTPIVVVSNEGASSSRESGARGIQKPVIPLSPPAPCSSSPTSSAQSTSTTCSSIPHSEHVEHPTCPPPAPRERVSSTITRKPCPGSTSHSVPAPDAPQERASSAPARNDSPVSMSPPTLVSALRLSLSSFVSTLVNSGKKSQHEPAIPKTREKDQMESERVCRWSASQTFLPLK